MGTKPSTGTFLRVLTFSLTLGVFAFQPWPSIAQSAGEAGLKGGQIFGDMDLNGDGQISYEEYEQKNRERFNRMDENGDNSISMEEAQSAVRSKMERFRSQGGGGDQGRRERIRQRLQERQGQGGVQ